MNIKQNITAIFASLALSCSACAGPSTQHLSTASEHATLASAHGTSTLIKGVASVAAVPLLVVGSAGVAIGTAGSAMVDFASQPLPLGDDHTTLESNTTPDPAVVIGKQTKN